MSLWAALCLSQPAAAASRHATARCLAALGANRRASASVFNLKSLVAKSLIHPKTRMESVACAAKVDFTASNHKHAAVRTDLTSATILP